MHNLIGVAEVSRICQVKQSKAYGIIRVLNQELEERGYLIIKGRINKNYLFERLGIQI